METKQAADSGKRRHSMVGTVSKAKMSKTVVVSVVRRTAHKVYLRGVKRTRRYMAHDPRGECRVGDQVVIVEARRLSRHKRWRVSQILRRDHAAR